MSERMQLKERVKTILTLIAPPVCTNAYRKMRRGKFYGITGDFSCWDQAERYLINHGEGDYSKPEIVDQVFDAIQAVRGGKAVFERDGVLFDKQEYNYPLLAALFKTISSCKNDRDIVNILDFGEVLVALFFKIEGI